MPVTSLFPRLVVSDADRAFAFYAQAFGAVVGACHRMGDGKVVHADLSMDGVRFFVKSADGPDADPLAVGGTPVLMSLYTSDSDAVFASAVAAGAEVIFPLATQFYGERGGRVRDPFGHVWIISTIVEALSAEEVERRMKAWGG
jgi:PhnB protein